MMQYEELIEKENHDLYNDKFEIPTIDLSTLFTNREDFIQKFGEGLTKIGFVILVNHGINPEIFERTEKKICELFETTPQEEKEKFLMKEKASVSWGYLPRNKSISHLHSNLIEAWKVGEFALNVEENPEYKESDFWPQTGYEPVFREFFISQKKLYVSLMTCLLQYFKLDPQLIDNHKLTNLNAHTRATRLNYYPALTPEDFLSKDSRLLAHYDTGVAMLIVAPQSEGLEVLNQADMKWVKINAPKNSLILNTGDYLQRITNDVIRAHTHRVVKPSPSQNIARVSYSFGFYYKDDEILEVLPGLGEPKYQPISAGEFISSQIALTNLKCHNNK